MNALQQELEATKLNLFGERDSLDEATQFALSYLTDSPSHAVITVMNVYRNTLINHVQAIVHKHQVH